MRPVADLFVGAPVAQSGQARAHAAEFGDDLLAWWAACPRGDWMLWAAGQAEVDTRELVSAALDCTEIVLPELVEESRLIAETAMQCARRWSAGQIGPGDCRRQADLVYKESERTMPIEDPEKAVARTAALGAIEAAVSAAAWSDDRSRCVEFAANAARRVANTFLRLRGPDDSDAAHARCADAVRAAIPERLLGG